MLRYTHFMLINGICAFFSIVGVTIWYLVTRTTPAGMSNFFYLLVFVFLVTEFVCGGIGLWLTFLQTRVYSKGSQKSSQIASEPEKSVPLKPIV
jgi:hypothetical protein